MNFVMQFLQRRREERERKAAMTHDLAALKRRLAVMPAEDDLWPRLLALLDAYVVSETKPLAGAGLDDAEAHRLRGRVGMLLDLKGDLENVRREAVREMIERQA